MDQTLIIGVGSHFGNDQLGWRVAEMLPTQLHSGIRTICVTSPAALLHLHGGVDRWVIVDALVDQARADSILRLEWPSEKIPALHPRGTHDLGLAAALRFVEAFGDLPRRVTIWVGVVRDEGEQLEFSAPAEQLALEIANRIRGELSTPTPLEPMLRQSQKFG